MNRPTIIVLLVLVAVLSSAATVLIVKENDKPALTEDQRAPRAKFFGSDKELPPIKEGQEMRPRW